MHFTSSLLLPRMSEFAKKLSQTLLSLALLFVVFLLPSILFAQTPIASYPVKGNSIGVSGNGLNATTLDDLSTMAYHYPALQIDGNRANLIKISGSFSYTPGSTILNVWKKLLINLQIRSYRTENGK